MLMDNSVNSSILEICGSFGKRVYKLVTELKESGDERSSCNAFIRKKDIGGIRALMKCSRANIRIEQVTCITFIE